MPKSKHLTESHKAAISNALTGIGNPQYGKRGEKSPNYGKKHSIERCMKNSLSHIGKTPSQETRKRLSEARIGEKNPFYGKTHTAETKEKISNAMSGKKRVARSAETRAKISAIHKGKIVSEKTRLLLSDMHSGDKCIWWQGGISFEPYCPQFNENLKIRVRAFFGNRCVLCGKSQSDCDRALSVHHVEYNKNACCDGKPVHFAALCHNCHSKTNTNRDRWEVMLHQIIGEIYNGRSYFTKEEWISQATEAEKKQGKAKEATA